MRHTRRDKLTFHSLKELSSAQCSDAEGELQPHWPNVSCTGAGTSVVILILDSVSIFRAESIDAEKSYTQCNEVVAMAFYVPAPRTSCMRI